MSGYKIIDFHTHIFPEKIAAKAVESIGRFYDLPMHCHGESGDLIFDGGRIGVEKYVVFSVATNVEQVTHINDFLAAQAKQHPEYIPFMTLHPDMADPEAEFERCLELGLRGVKIHPDFQAFYLDDTKSYRLFELVDGRVPIMTHAGDDKRDFSSPKRLAKVLDKFPNQTVIAAHLGGYAMWDLAKEYIIGRNLYLDTSSSLAFLSKEEAAEMIRRHGTDKILFGTDYPMWNHNKELELFLQLDLNEEERKAILYDNAAGLLNI